MTPALLIFAWAVTAPRAPLCWPGGAEDPETLAALRAATPNVRLDADCDPAACASGDRWCLGWSSTRRALFARAGRTRLERRVGVEAPDLAALVATRGAPTVSVYLESLAVEAGLTTPERPPPPSRPRRSVAPAPPATTATTATTARARPSLAPPVWAGRIVVSPLDRPPAAPARVHLDGEAGVRFRSPGAWAPTLAVRGARSFGPRDRLALVGRLRFTAPVREDAGGLRLETWGLGADLGLALVAWRAPGWCAALELGATLEGLSVTELRVDGDVTRGGVAGGPFVGGTVSREWGPVRLGVLAAGLWLPTGLVLRKNGGDEQIGQAGFRGAVTLGLRF